MLPFLQGSRLQEKNRSQNIKKKGKINAFVNNTDLMSTYFLWNCSAILCLGCAPKKPSAEQSHSILKLPGGFSRSKYYSLFQKPYNNLFQVLDNLLTSKQI